MTAQTLPEDDAVVSFQDEVPHLLDSRPLSDRTFEEKVRDLFTAAISRRAAISDLAACLPGLVVALGWTGVPRQLVEALPADETAFDLVDLTNTLARLGFIGSRSTLDPADLADRGPVLWLRRGEPAVVVLDQSDQGLLVFDAALGEQRLATLPLGKIDALVFVDVRADFINPGVKSTRSWFGTMLARFRSMWSAIFIAGIAVNILALSIPLFVMYVYDGIITTGDRNGIWLLLIGVVSAILIEMSLRGVRSRMQIFIASRLNYLVGSKVLDHMLGLSLSVLERAGSISQIARIRDLERIRGVIAGSLATALLEFPVLLVFVAAIALVGGWLAVVPVASAIVLACAALVYNRAIDRRSSDSARVGVLRQSLILEVLDKMRAVRVTGAAPVYRRRFAELSAQSAEANFAHARTSAVAQSFAQCVLMLSMLGMLGLGVDGVLEGSLTAGGLIAVMMLGWRIQGPLQSAFMASTRLFQLRSSARQIDTLMAQPSERPWDVEGTAITGVAGRINLEMVTFKAAADQIPVLMNVSVDIQPGELVAVTGPNGIGNSSLLALIAGLHHPQGGAVRIDGRDVRQFDPPELRQVLAYASHAPELFDGTIAENLRLAAPTADDRTLENALELAGVRDLVLALPDGLQTRIDGSGSNQFPSSVLGQLSLARAYARGAPILLLDEPVGSFDFEGEFAFVDALNQLRGKTTVVLVTYRPSHIRMADKVLVMKDGTSRYFGPPGPVIEKITEAFSKEMQKELPA